MGVREGYTLVPVRGVRFSAGATSVVLAAALTVRGDVGMHLVAWQWSVAVLAACVGMRYSLYGKLWNGLIRVANENEEMEPAAGPRFAQACGAALLSGALAAYVLGASNIAWTLVAVMLALSTLLATTRICLGCLMYGMLSGHRMRKRRRHEGAPGRMPPSEVAPGSTAGTVGADG